MRQLSIILLLISTLIFGTITPTFSAIKGKIDYSIPIDYSKISEKEVEIKAREYFYLAEQLKDGVINEDMTNALVLYNLLQDMHPEKIEYSVKLGILYDKIEKDRQAKGAFSRAIFIDKNHPLPYFYMGEFYYKRALYRRALKYYRQSYEKGFENNYNLLYKIGDIYEKLGDTQKALTYLNKAKEQSFNPELEEKIKEVESQDSINKEFNSEHKIKETM